MNGNHSGEQELVVTADPIDRAREHLDRRLGAGAVREHDGALRVGVGAGQVPEINRWLVEAGIDVHGLHLAERALEDVFFELTSGRETSDAR